MGVFANLSTVELIVYIALAVVALVAVVMLIVSAVFAKNTRITKPLPNLLRHPSHNPRRMRRADVPLSAE